MDDLARPGLRWYTMRRSERAVACVCADQTTNQPEYIAGICRDMHPKCYLIKTSEALKPLHLSRFNSKLFSLFELSFLDFLCFLGKRVGFRLGGELLTAKTHSLRPFGKRVGKTHSLTENPLI